MTDTRTYIKVHDGMPDHPKIEPLSDRAFRLLIELWCWCSRQLTDGFVPEAIWRRRSSPKVRRELLDAGLVVSVDRGVEMHDYRDHQRSKAEVLALRETRKEAGKRGGKASAKTRAKPEPLVEQNPTSVSVSVKEEPSSSSPNVVENGALDHDAVAKLRQIFLDRGHDQSDLEACLARLKLRSFGVGEPVKDWFAWLEVTLPQLETARVEAAEASQPKRLDLADGTTLIVHPDGRREFEETS